MKKGTALKKLMKERGRGLKDKKTQHGDFKLYSMSKKILSLRIIA